MRLSDFFIGKPGPGSISEALAMRLPVIVQRNFLTLPQERYNAQWVVEKQVGFAVAKAHEFPNAVGELLRPENFEKFRKNAAALNNRAVFEIPEILRRIAG
jgi:1,2-diacylglycerol 3-beta-galactosyltransferase